MKRFILLVGFVVLWKQWEVVKKYIGQGIEASDVEMVPEIQKFDTLQDARNFVSRHKKDERYTDMHIFKIGEEVQP